eukprot:scaffold5199_cov199-Alexandrium_tamarense.AAC.22
MPIATVVDLRPSSSSPPQRHQLQHQQASPTNLRTYRGGFTSSICSIFTDPTRRQDCCAVACCGVLASDRTRYLLTGERPPPLWRRLVMYLIVPALFLAAMNYFAVEVQFDENGVDGSSSSNYNPYGEGDDSSKTTTRKVAPLPLTLAFYAYLILLTAYGIVHKQSLRKEIMTRLYEERTRARGEEVSDIQLKAFIQRHQLDIGRAHYCCSCCYASDESFLEESGIGAESSFGNGREGTEVEEDFCTSLWKCLSNTFWNVCCGCWCQCWSICALAQEEREAERLTGNQTYTMDYVTFQPYSEYYPSIQALKDNGVTSLWKHMQAISELSLKLLKNVAAVIVVLILFALSDVDANFNFENMIVLLLTLVQAFFIEWLVHWKYCRFDLSFDSVVKYFACGFLLTTPMAVLFEGIISTLTSLIGGFVVVFIFASDDDIAREVQADPTKAIKDFVVKYQGFFVFNVFINSFVVAALCEELVKYFGYWMVVVPDLLPQEQRVNLASRNATDASNTEESEEDLDTNQNNQLQPRKSAVSTGNAITVAMVSVALGFACCENLIYIFVYSPPSLGMGKILTRGCRLFH